MEPQALITDLNRAYGMDLSDHLQTDQVETLLAEKINAMINRDFSALVQLLYRVDVSEPRLRSLLKGNTSSGEETSDAGRLIARLILERLWQKILNRREFGRDNARPTAGDEEGW